MEVRNRFKELDLIDRVPDELWNEVHDIVQKTGIKTIPMENKCKNAKWLSGEALQIALKRREAKSKGEKERYKHLNDGVITHLEPDILEWEVKWALEIAVKRREVKSKGEKKRYKHLNAEFQRIARRGKRAFLSDQHKEIEETIDWERLEISSRKLEIPRKRL